jgi:NADH-quinone oxidoreductase subunit N
MNLVQDLGLLAPVIVLIIAAAVVLLLTVAHGYGRPAPQTNGHMSFVALAGLAVAGWLLWKFEGGSHVAFSGAIIVDGLGVVFSLTAIVGAFLAVLIATSYLNEHELAHGEFIALVLLSTVGMLILSMAGDLITLFIGIEVMSIAVYVLAGYRRASRRSQEAALKYFIYGAFASSFVLFGVALIYGEVGRLLGKPGVTMQAVAQTFTHGDVSSLGWIGVALVIGGLGFKVAAVPFHMWAPDVYEGAPTPSTGFMAVGVKAAAFAGLLRFAAATLVHAPDGRETFVQIFELLAILTMVTGNLLAIRQQQVKRMLAYSSIAHAGYVFVGLAAFVAQPEGRAIEAIGYYLLGYTAMTLGAFGVVLAFERRGDRRLDLPMERLSGTGHKYPALGLAMSLFMLSLAGIPPTAGFFGKLAVFAAAVEAGRTAIVVVAVLASVAGAFYYLRVLVTMYMRATGSDETRIHSPWLSAGLWACAALTAVAGLLPEGYLSFAHKALAGWLG